MAIRGSLGYLLFVVVIPVAGTWGAVALLAGAFDRGWQLNRRVLGAVGLLLVPGLLICATASGPGYAPIVAMVQILVASAAALVGAVVLIWKPPAARRIAGLLLITIYPLGLVGLGWAGNVLVSSDTVHLVRVAPG